MSKRILNIINAVKSLNTDIFIHMDLTIYHLWKTDQVFKKAFLLNNRKKLLQSDGTVQW